MPSKKKNLKNLLDLNEGALCCTCIARCVKDAQKSLKAQLFKTKSNFFIPGVHDEQAK